MDIQAGRASLLSDVSIERPEEFMMEILTQSVVTCPNCGAQTEETMPTDACVVFFQCGLCRVVVRPESGDCCVFCSYGSVPCPPVQVDQDCRRTS